MRWLICDETSCNNQIQFNELKDNFPMGWKVEGEQDDRRVTCLECRLKKLEEFKNKLFLNERE